MIMKPKPIPSSSSSSFKKVNSMHSQYIGQLLRHQYQQQQSRENANVNRNIIENRRSFQNNNNHNHNNNIKINDDNADEYGGELEVEEEEEENENYFLNQNQNQNRINNKNKNNNSRSSARSKKTSSFTSSNNINNRKMVQIGQAHFSVKYLVASALIFWSGLCTIVAFAGPYWSQSYPSTGNEFKNIGLWEACFNRYRHWKDDNQKPYTGCFWFWSPDMIRFRDWLMPPWFIAVQFFACFGLIFEFVVLAFLSVSFMTNIRFKFYFVFPITILTFISVVMMFLAMLIYGINGDNREWMPRPEFNVYSWAYWFELSAAFFLTIATILLLLESKDLYAVYKKNQQIKRQYEMAMPLNSTLHLNLNSSISNRASNYA